MGVPGSALATRFLLGAAVCALAMATLTACESESPDLDFYSFPDPACGGFKPIATATTLRELRIALVREDARVDGLDTLGINDRGVRIVALLNDSGDAVGKLRVLQRDDRWLAGKRQYCM